MAPTNMRFVVHLDILGMSELVEANAERAWQVLSDLVKARNEVTTYEVTALATSTRTAVQEQVRCVTFSDTIVLYSKSDTDLDLQIILIMAIEIFNKALSRCVPVRVGITHGQFFFNLDDSMFAGPALIEAYRLGEQAQWLGLVASETVYQRTKTAALKSKNADFIVKASIPVTAGSYSGYAVNWPEILPRHSHVRLPISVAQFYSAFEHLFGSFDALPTKVKAKYANTVEFFNARTTVR